MRRGSGELSHASTGLVLLLLGCGGTSGTRSPEGGSAAVDGGPRTTDGAHRLADTGADTRTHRSPDAPGGMRAVDGGRGDVGHLEASPGDAWAFAPTLTLESLTQNNTSACGTGADPCASAWDPTRTVTYSGGSTYAGQMRTVTAFWDSAVPPGPQAPGSAYGHVSKVPVSALLPGHDVPVWVETQNWFGAGNGHIDNGEVSTRGAQMANQVADHISRGFAGQVLDWYGPGTTADLGLPTIQASAEASSGAYKFAVMIDKGYFTTCGETVRCLNDGLAYVATHYGVSPAYLKDAGGHPVVFFFINQYYPTEYGILTGPGVDAAGTVFEMYEPNGFPGKDPANTAGEYSWVNPADGAITTTTGAQGSFGWATDFGFKDLNSFFSAARVNQSSVLVSEAHKGFDDNLANWSLNRIVDPQCGATWLQTFHHTGSFGGSSSYEGNLDYLAAGEHLDFIMVDTWDDYEEGTEIETGIDNCMVGLDVSLAGTVLSWAPTWGADPMNDAVTGSEETVYEYSVYLGTPAGSAVMWQKDLLCTNGTCPHSVDVSDLGIQGGPYVFFVQAVGQPSIVNHLGGPTATTYASP